MRDTGTPIIVGAGAGGLIAAIHAHDLGLHPIVVEAADLIGGATAFSGGQVWVGANHVMERIGVPDTLDETRTYVKSIGVSGEGLDPAVFEQWVTAAPDVALALEQNGVIEWTHVPHLCDYHYPGTAGSKPEGRYLACEAIEGASLGEHRARLLVSPHHPPGPTWEELFAVWGDGEKVRELCLDRARKDILTFGTGLAAWFYKAALERGIDIRTEHRATELILSGPAVTGVRCETPNGAVEFTGPVILATGSYDHNPEMVHEYSGLEPDQTGSVAPRAYQGDGITLGKQAGAHIYRMPLRPSVHVSGYTAAPVKGHDMGDRFCLQLSFPHSFMVDGTGRRFCDDSYYREISSAILTEGLRSHLPYFLIWDEEHHQRYGLDPAAPGEPYPPEMHVASADTIEQLAIQLGIDPTALSETTARFNDGAETGEDPEFGRGTNAWASSFLGDPAHRPSTILGPVATPPFYGMRMRLVGTAVGAAGVHAGTDGRALRPDGSAIPGLYAVGAAAAFTSSGTGYNSGMALSRAITFGWLAAEHVHAGAPTPAVAG
jgi:3-oxosteroid 1-dehydrogenase